MGQVSALIQVMTGAARKAGRRLARDFNEIENLQVTKKGPADFVSKADHKSEEIIFEELPKDDPQVRQPDISRAKEVLGWTPTVDRRGGSS